MGTPQRVLVLGSNGLVGSSCVRMFSNLDSYEVVKSTRQDTNLFSFDETKKLIEEKKPDILINAAAKVGGIHANNTQRVEFLIENLKINTNVLEACLNYSNITIINLGSSCIYPLNAKDPIKESNFMEGKLEPTNSPYAMAKLTAIELGRSLALQYGHKVINLMPTNLYGPNDNFHSTNSHFLPSLIKKFHSSKIGKKKAVEVWGSGKAKRDMMYVYDLADAISFLLEKLLRGDKKLNKIIKKTSFINVGTGIEHTVKFFVKMIQKVINPNAKVQFNLNYPDGTPRKLLNSQTMKNLGWKPKTSFEIGLNKTYQWYIKRKKK